LNGQPYKVEFVLKPSDNHRLALLCGQFDEHLRWIENALSVEINSRGNFFQVIGEPDAAKIVHGLLLRLYSETENDRLSKALVLEHVSEAEELLHRRAAPPTDLTNIKTPKLLLKPRSANQERYLANMLKHDINFGIGPAGTGKTYLAVARAVDYLMEGKVTRIILVRPAVEAGEKLGFLPGDLAQKVDPYLRPLYDALYEMLGPDRVLKFIEQQVIEIAPLAFMRGRTLNDAFIILDESQNTTPEQMKMFLTRIGFNSKTVITGDITQVDLPRGRLSGLRQIIDVLKDVSDISFTFFAAHDVVRHPLVQKIVEAYNQYDTKNKEDNSNNDSR
jgi:phosphate starvation-inducible PhoH-like protein